MRTARVAPKRDDETSEEVSSLTGLLFKFLYTRHDSRSIHVSLLSYYHDLMSSA